MTHFSGPDRPQSRSETDALRTLATATRQAMAARQKADADARPSIVIAAERAFASIIPRQEYTPPPVAEEKRVAMEERRRAQEAEQRLERAQRLWEMSNIYPIHADADFGLLGESTDPRQTAVAEKLRGMMGRPGMQALVGTRGTGKTWMAVALIRENCRAGRRARYTRAIDFFRAVRATFADRDACENDVVAELSKPDLLVLDEMQVRSESVWENNQLTALIDDRYANLKATVLIANLTPDALVQNLGESIVSRLQECGGISVCTWESYRKSGQAHRPAPPVVDVNSGKFQFTPVATGAVPSVPGRRIYQV